MFQNRKAIIDELLEDLSTFWNASEDKRYVGEHPKCADILEQIEEQFQRMTDDEITEILDDLPEEQLEYLLTVFEDMVDDRPVFENYM